MVPLDFLLALIVHIHRAASQIRMLAFLFTYQLERGSRVRTMGYTNSQNKLVSLFLMILKSGQ